MRFIPLLLAILIAGCTVAPRESSGSAQNLTVGTVQKEVRLGMTGAEVASVLGSPNIVSTDAERREVWIYDKVATDYVSTSANGWVFALVAGGSQSSRSASRSQRTLTIIIKFDEDKLVRDFAYHTSKF